MVAPHVVRGPYTAPLSLNGILMILSSGADAGIRDDQNRLTGVDADGEFHLDIPDAVPVPALAAGDEGPGEMFLVPDGAYSLAVRGRQAGSYTFSSIARGRMLATSDDRGSLTIPRLPGFPAGYFEPISAVFSA